MHTTWISINYERKIKAKNRKHLALGQHRWGHHWSKPIIQLCISIPYYNYKSSKYSQGKKRGKKTKLENQTQKKKNVYIKSITSNLRNGKLKLQRRRSPYTKNTWWGMPWIFSSFSQPKREQKQPRLHLTNDIIYLAKHSIHSQRWHDKYTIRKESPSKWKSFLIPHNIPINHYSD